VRHVLWVGGPPAAGKSTLARRLTRRHGLRLYSADTRTWEHRTRAVAAGIEAAVRWEALAPEACWAAPVGELFDMSLHSERGSMVIDDLRGLPAAPLLMADGSTLPADIVARGIADPAHVLWLVPTMEFQNEQLDRLGTAPGPASLYRALRDTAERDVEEFGLPSLVLDGSVGIDQVVARAEWHFSDVLAAGPLAQSLKDRRQLLRHVNLDVVHQVKGYYHHSWATGTADPVEQSFVCECADRRCEFEVTVTVRQAAEGPVFAAGHH
jgi:hypothetical protein